MVPAPTVPEPEKASGAVRSRVAGPVKAAEVTVMPEAVCAAGSANEPEKETVPPGRTGDDGGGGGGQAHDGLPG